MLPPPAPLRALRHRSRPATGVGLLLLLAGCRGCRDEDQPAPHGDLGELKGCEETWVYLDQDGDRYGDPASAVRACDPPETAVSNPLDCDDGDPAVSPEGEALCADGLDNDCDGAPDCASLERVLHPDDASAVLVDQPGGSAGYAMGIVDITGDGVVDLLLGAPTAEEGDYRGRTYLVPGPVHGEIDLTSPDVADISSDALNQDGLFLSTGDLDGNGYEDMQIGTVGGGADENSVYIVPGPLDSEQDYELGRDGATHLYLPYTETDSGGLAVLETGALLGDDDQLDLMFDSSRINGGAGAVFVMPGPITEDGSMIELAHTALYGVYDGEVGDLTSANVVGDINGDGVHDLASKNGDFLYVMFELPEGLVDVADIAEVTIDAATDAVGMAFFSPGDVDGDGLDDLLSTGTNAYDVYWSGGGQVYLFSSATLNGADGGMLEDDRDLTALIVGTGNSQMAMGMAAPGDLNEDGFADIFLGDPECAAGEDDEDPGRAALWYGPIEGTYQTDEADSRVLGDTIGSRLGWRVAARPRDALNNALLLVGAWPFDGNSTLYQYTPDGY